MESITNKWFCKSVKYCIGQWNQNEISSVEFSESVVTLDVDGHTIITTIDSDMISDEIQQYTEVPTEIQMMNMATEVMQDLSIELVDGNCE